MALPILTRKDGTLPIEDAVRKILREAIKGRRKEIACRISEILGRTVSESMLADFTRNATKRRQVRFPAPWVAAFCEAVGSDELWICVAPESSRRALAVRTGIIKSCDAVARAQEALGLVQGELERLAEGNGPKITR